MTAQSPFAPLRRNSYLTHSRSSMSSNALGEGLDSSAARGGPAALGVAALLFLIRFWRKDGNRDRRALWTWISQIGTGRRMLAWLERSGLFSLLRLEPPSQLLASQGTDKAGYSMDRAVGEDDDDEWHGRHAAGRHDDTSTKGTLLHQNSSSLPSPQPSSSAYSTSAERIAENQRLIQEVLKYWYGQYTPKESQKNLWMIASSSTDLRSRVDREITERFGGLLLELYCQTTTTTTTPGSRWKEWAKDDQQIYGIHGKVAAIIVLDQFSRHIHRYVHAENECGRTSIDMPYQVDLDLIAFQTAQRLFDNHKNEIECGMLPLPMVIFSLMPFRHASTVESVQFVQGWIDKCTDRNGQMEAMLSRFRKATNRRMAVLQDEARRVGKMKSETSNRFATTLSTTAEAASNIAASTTTTTNSSSNYKNQVDDKEQQGTSPVDGTFTDEEILEVFPFEADMKEAKNHPVVKTIIDFLTREGVQPNTELPTPIIVSLSGGVDSMVIASALSYLRTSCDYNLHVVGVHIDYANRPESGAEADFVERYCNQIGIGFDCRRIGEVTRGIAARDEYEQVSREIRYMSYRKVIAECKEHVASLHGNDPTAGSGPTTVGVMLGHHRGDLRENVLSNAHKGCGPLDLSGMTAVSINNGVTIYRPLLALEKTSISDYAHKYGVPYFKDTTPHWSTRGKLRNKLLPLLEEIYGEGSMNNLSSLAIESDDCRKLLQDRVFDPFLKSIVRKPMGIMFETKPFRDHSPFFWKLVLREALHSAGLGMFSDRSVASFLERVTGVQTQKQPQQQHQQKTHREPSSSKTSNQENAARANQRNRKRKGSKQTNGSSFQSTGIKAGWLQCRKDYAVYMDAKGRIFVFYPSSFPFRKADLYDVDGQVVRYSKENAVQVGPWQVSCEISQQMSSSAPASSSSGDEMAKAKLSQKAVPSMESFMNGHIEYYLKAPSLKSTTVRTDTQNDATSHGDAVLDNDADYKPGVLQFLRFTKASRPLAWKSCDLKIQATLPLLGNGPVSVGLLQSDSGQLASHLVKVTLQLQGTQEKKC